MSNLPERRSNQDISRAVERTPKGQSKRWADREVEVLTNQPRHNIRAIPANPQDQIYCERLGALAVDNALAGLYPIFQ